MILIGYQLNLTKIDCVLNAEEIGTLMP